MFTLQTVPQGAVFFMPERLPLAPTAVASFCFLTQKKQTIKRMAGPNP